MVADSNDSNSTATSATNTKTASTFTLTTSVTNAATATATASGKNTTGSTTTSRSRITTTTSALDTVTVANANRTEKTPAPLFGQRSTKGNVNTSTSTLSRAQKAYVRHWTIKLRPISQHGNAPAECWKYFGNLCDGQQGAKVIEPGKLFCKICLENEQALGDKGHPSQVARYSEHTSTTNLNLHLSMKHGIRVASSNDNVSKIAGYLKKYSSGVDCSGAALSSHEVNSYLTLWFCKDLLSFDTVAKKGFQGFFAKNFPSVSLPSATTLSCSALDDIYHAVYDVVKIKLADAKSLCLMFDGWTDKYRSRPYMGIRASFLDDWKYQVVTLGCHVIVGHTAHNIAYHLNGVLKVFFLTLSVSI